MHQTSHKILLVEDDADDRYAIHVALVELGYEEQVKVFDRSEDLLKHLRTLPDPSLYPALVVLDVNMPGMTGSELLMRMRLDEAFRAIPVAMYSTGIGAQKSRFIAMGASYCFDKGAEVKDFLHLAKTFRTIAEGEFMEEEKLATEL